LGGGGGESCDRMVSFEMSEIKNSKVCLKITMLTLNGFRPRGDNVLNGKMLPCQFVLEEAGGIVKRFLADQASGG